LTARIRRHYESMAASTASDLTSKIITDLPPNLRQNIATTVFADLIGEQTLFHGMPEQVVSALFLRLRVCHVREGEEFFGIGDIGSEMYFLLSGEVDFLIDTGRTIATCYRGSTFGERALLCGHGEEERRSVAAVAKVASEALKLSREDFDLIIDDFPEYRAHVEERIQNQCRKMDQAIRLARSQSFVSPQSSANLLEDASKNSKSTHGHSHLKMRGGGGHGHSHGSPAGVELNPMPSRAPTTESMASTSQPAPFPVDIRDSLAPPAVSGAADSVLASVEFWPPLDTNRPPERGREHTHELSEHARGLLDTAHSHLPPTATTDERLRRLEAQMEAMSDRQIHQFRAMRKMMERLSSQIHEIEFSS